MSSLVSLLKYWFCRRVVYASSLFFIGLIRCSVGAHASGPFRSGCESSETYMKKSLSELKNCIDKNESTDASAISEIAGACKQQNEDFLKAERLLSFCVKSPSPLVTEDRHERR